MLGLLRSSLLTAFVGKLFHSSLEFWTKVTYKALNSEGGRGRGNDRGREGGYGGRKERKTF